MRINQTKVNQYLYNDTYVGKIGSMESLYDRHRPDLGTLKII